MGFVVQSLLFTFLLCSSIFVISESSTNHNHHHHGHHSHHHHRRSHLKKLFVFGDSYADTGNNRKTLGSSWKVPYGVTFPGKPSGRFSDGRVFTDFLAKSLGLKSPVAYRWMKYTPKNLKYGVNFAYGGTGVFDTLAPYPNMTTQIDFFEQLIEKKVFSPLDVQNSVALVSLAGNDYSAYNAKGGTQKGLQTFIEQVVTQLAVDIQRIYSLGVRKIAVTALQPLGCLPQSTILNGFQECNSTDNLGVNFHNLLLQQAVTKLGNQANYSHGYPIVIIDLYNAFFTVLQAKSGSSIFNSPLKPCCMGVNQNYYCGSLDAEGNKMYTVCQDPKSSFFWDSVHPTQAGWRAVSLALQGTLEELRSN